MVPLSICWALRTMRSDECRGVTCTINGGRKNSEVTVFRDRCTPLALLKGVFSRKFGVPLHTRAEPSGKCSFLVRASRVPTFGLAKLIARDTAAAAEFSTVELKVAPGSPRSTSVACPTEFGRCFAGVPAGNALTECMSCSLILNENCEKVHR